MPSDPLVLGFDTSAAHCAAALLCGSRLVAQRSEDVGTGQAERLFPMLEEILAEAGAGWGELTALGVGVGPGNFTGIRIAVASARGLALALRIPCVGVSGFAARAHGAGEPVLAVIPARRGQSWAQLRGADGAAADAAFQAAPETLPAALAGSGIAVVGDTAAAFAAVTGGRAAAPMHPLAEAIARIARARRDDPGPRPAPLYLRAADAAPAREPPPPILP